MSKKARTDVLGSRLMPGYHSPSARSPESGPCGEPGLPPGARRPDRRRGKRVGRRRKGEGRCPGPLHAVRGSGEQEKMLHKARTEYRPKPLGSRRSARHEPGQERQRSCQIRASTRHHKPCSPAGQLDGTRPCHRGLSKLCQAANAAAHSCGWCRWLRRTTGTARILARKALIHIGEAP
jgi:hypothetical protein